MASNKSLPHASFNREALHQLRVVPEMEQYPIAEEFLALLTNLTGGAALLDFLHRNRHLRPNQQPSFTDFELDVLRSIVNSTDSPVKSPSKGNPKRTAAASPGGIETVNQSNAQHEAVRSTLERRGFLRSLGPITMGFMIGYTNGSLIMRESPEPEEDKSLRADVAAVSAAALAGSVARYAGEKLNERDFIRAMQIGPATRLLLDALQQDKGLRQALDDYGRDAAKSRGRG